LLGIFADITFATHAVFVVLAIPSTLLALAGAYRKLPQAWAVHSLSMLIMATGTLTFGRCPLVELEDAFRTAAGEPMPYTGSFVNYCLNELVGTPLPTGSMFYISFSIAILSLGALIVHWPFLANDQEAEPVMEPSTA
jgi:hypothetical protein